jgi:hypothetical protein
VDLDFNPPVEEPLCVLLLPRREGPPTAGPPAAAKAVATRTRSCERETGLEPAASTLGSMSSAWSPGQPPLRVEEQRFSIDGGAKHLILTSPGRASLPNRTQHDYDSYSAQYRLRSSLPGRSSVRLQCIGRPLRSETSAEPYCAPGLWSPRFQRVLANPYKRFNRVIVCFLTPPRHFQ